MSRTPQTILRVAVFFSLLLSQQLCFAQASPDSRKTTVDRFLTVWLVRKNITAALRFFHPQALKSFPVIDNCIGKEYVAASDENNPIAIRRAVRKSLRVSSARTRGQTLRTILFREGKDAPRQQTAYLAELTGDSFNQPKRDHYWLMTFEKIKSRTGQDTWDEYEKRYDMRNAFVSIIQYHLLTEDPQGDDLVVMFLWVKRGPEWKIVFVRYLSVTLNRGPTANVEAFAATLLICWRIIQLLRVGYCPERATDISQTFNLS